MAFYRLEPFGPKREEIHAALIASVIANVNRDPDKHPAPFQIEDFLLDFDEDERHAGNSDLLAKLHGMGFFKNVTNE